MSPAPRNTQNIMKASCLSSLVLFGLNKKSLANSSTNPVYTRIPAEVASSTPLMTFAVKLPELYVVRRPSPMAMAIGVVSPYAVQKYQGRLLKRLGNGIADRRAPIPRPSKDW